MTYDDTNVFAKILREEIPCDKVLENDVALVFRDVQPQAPCHMLAIPKGPYSDYADFMERASEAEILGLTQIIYDALDQEGLQATGYRLISNAGIDGGQEVPHYHVHILGGRELGAMLSR